MRRHLHRVVIALIATLLSALTLLPAGSPPAEAQQAPEFVTLANGYSHGWVLADGTKQWIDQTCRTELEGDGATFVASGWSAFGSLPLANPQLRCDQIVELFGGTTPNPDAAAFVTNSANNSAGWVLVNSTRQWLNSNCRQQLEVAGAAFAITPWSIIGATPSTSTPLTCEQMEALVGGGTDANISLVVTTVNVNGGFVLTDTTRQWIPQSCVSQLTAAGATFTPTPWSQFSNLVDNPGNLSCNEIEALLNPTDDSCVTFTSDERWATAEARYSRSWNVIIDYDPITGEPNFEEDTVDEDYEARLEPSFSDFLTSWSDNVSLRADGFFIGASAYMVTTQSADAGYVSMDFFDDPSFETNPPFNAWDVNDPGEGSARSEATYAADFTSNSTCTLNFSGFLSQNRGSWDRFGGERSAQQNVTVQQLVNGVWVDVLHRAMPAYDENFTPVPVLEEGDDWVLPVDDTITLVDGGQYRMEVYAKAGGSYFFGQGFVDNSEVTINLDWTLTEPAT